MLEQSSVKSGILSQLVDNLGQGVRRQLTTSYEVYRCAYVSYVYYFCYDLSIKYYLELVLIK